MSCAPWGSCPRPAGWLLRSSSPAQHLAAQALTLGKVAFKQADPLGGTLGRCDAVRVLLGAHMAQGVVKGIVCALHGTGSRFPSAR
jgi:hypothetical protein